MINIEPIKAFSDNYIWLVTTNEGSIVIDPGESHNILSYLDDNQLKLEAILITHHHFDHTGGIKDIKSLYPVEVYGPCNSEDTITKNLTEGDIINVIGIEFEIIEIPGHTLDHIAFYSRNNDEPILFCGDTLFAGGCGRVFEGTYEQMFDSLVKLKKLPNNTKIFCGHEYTESNLKFAKDVEPLNENINSRYNEVVNLRKQSIPTIPSTLYTELKTNPFLRTDEKTLQNIITERFDIENDDKEIFKALRQWKDNY